MGTMQAHAGMRPRTIDAHNMQIIHRGNQWPHDVPPCSKTMTHHLERNEAVVSWLQPIGGGVAEQVPCIQAGDILFPLSLRMQKAVWRHVRLKKDYVNIEPLSHGGYKLKIPHLLLREKVRTQARFNVSKPHVRMIVCMVYCISRIVFTLLTIAHTPEHATGKDRTTQQ
jgi:hypothetical protein